MRQQFYLSIGLLIKDENEYLQEWIEHHLNLGVEHFFIYDNLSTTKIEDTVQNLGLLKYCTIKRVSKDSYPSLQKDVYKECIQQHKDHTKWLGFLDTDEFIEVNGNSSFIDFLKKYENRFDALWFPWKTFNANGHITKPSGKVQDNFTTIHNKFPTSFPMNGKGFYIVSNIDPAAAHAHFIPSSFGRNKHGILRRNIRLPKEDMIYIRHYYTKSFEEWCEKMRRGSCDPKNLRAAKEFFEYNPDLKTSVPSFKVTSQTY